MIVVPNNLIYAQDITEEPTEDNVEINNIDSEINETIVNETLDQEDTEIQNTTEINAQESPSTPESEDKDEDNQ